MSLPGEEQARADLARQFRDLFDRADRVHDAAVELITRGQLKIRKPQGFSPAVVALIASLYTKACKTFRAIQLTCEAGLGQDASVLARQLMETAVAVAFILDKDSIRRAGMYAAYEDQRLLVLLERASEIDGLKELASPEALEKARLKVRKWDSAIGDDAVASVRNHWSGRSLEWAAGQVGMVYAYALMYRATSAFAHGADVSQHVYVKKGSDVPTLKLAPGDDQIRRVLPSSISLMRMIVGSLNAGFGLGEEAVIERIDAEIPRREKPEFKVSTAIGGDKGGDR
jgi:hypothetical protein